MSDPKGGSAPPPPGGTGGGGDDSTRIINLKDSITRPTGRLVPVFQVVAGADQGKVFVFEPENPRIIVGRSQQCNFPVMDASCSRQHAEFVLGIDEVVTIHDMGSTNGTRVNGVKLAEESVVLKDGDRLQLGDNTIIRFAMIPEEDARAQMEVYFQATRDPLTGANNRRQFEDTLARELAFLKRGGMGLGLIFMDVDFFKKINDTYGHPAGDEVLRDLVKRVSDMIRQEDLFARIGGEEFALIVRSDALEGVTGLAERIRAIMEKTASSFEGRSIPFTMSLGVTYSAAKNDIRAQDFISGADQALYSAKHSGRNRVVTGKIY